METKMMAAVLNDNVIDKVVGRKKKEKVEPKEFGADDFHSIAPDQMKQVLRGLNDVLQIAETLDAESAMRIKRRIEVVEDILCQKLKQIEDPDNPNTANEMQRWMDQYRPQDTTTGGQVWINTTPDTVVTPYIQPHGAGGGSGSSGDIIWRTMDTSTAIPQFTSGNEEISGWGGLLPKDDDE